MSIIDSSEALAALPVHSYFRCGCDYHGTKEGPDRYRLGGKVMGISEVARDHLPLTVLYRAPLPEYRRAVEEAAREFGVTTEQAARGLENLLAALDKEAEA